MPDVMDYADVLADLSKIRCCVATIAQPEYRQMANAALDRLALHCHAADRRVFPLGWRLAIEEVIKP